MGIGIPPIQIKIMLESNPVKSTMLVGGLAVAPLEVVICALPKLVLGQGRALMVILMLILIMMIITIIIVIVILIA